MGNNRVALAVLGAALAAAGCGGGSGQWVKEEAPALPMSSTYRLWVFAEDNVWLGGASVWNFDGSGWTEVALPVAGTGVNDFWGFAPDDLWAIGNNGVFHFDGTDWTEVPSGDSFGFESLGRIWGTDSTHLWVANGDNSKVYHYDGTAWTRQTLQFIYVNALWGTAEDDIWLTGPVDAYHYDGAGWSVFESPNFGPDPSGAYAMWGAASDDVWASTSPGFIHWDGIAWNELEGEETYNSMWGFGADDIIAVGNRGTMAVWDGSSWDESDGHLSGQQNFTHVQGSSPDNVWATAVDFDTFAGLVLRLEP